MLLLWYFGAFIVVLYAAFTFSVRNKLVVNKMFPGPPLVPVFGNAWALWGTPEELYERIMYWFMAYKNQNIRFWLFHRAYVAIVSCKSAKILLSSTTHLDKADDYKFFLPWLGHGVFTAPAETWRRNRKLIAPAFHFKVLVGFIDVFNTNVNILCDKLTAHDGGEAFDAYKYVILLALDNICETALGTKINSQSEAHSEYAEAVKNVTEAIFQRLTRIFLRPEKIFNKTRQGILHSESIKYLHNYAYDIIRTKRLQRKARQEQKELVQNGDEGMHGKQKMVFIDMMLESLNETGWSDEKLREEVDVTVFGGYDTAASSLAFTLHCLAENQSVQDKAYEEIKRIFGDDTRNATYNDVQEMKYVEQVIKESLRLFPSATFIGRRIDQDLHLDNGQYIPKGVTAMICVGAIHRDPAQWPNPLIFDPDRFTPEESQKRHPFAFLPFSAGPRNCVGQKYAMMEMKITICGILRRYQILPCLHPEDKPRLRIGVILTSSNGVRIRLKSRAAKK